MDILEKLAKCSTPGEVDRMLRGNGYVLVKDEDGYLQDLPDSREDYDD